MSDTDYQKTCYNCIFADWDKGQQVGCKVRPNAHFTKHLADGHWDMERGCHFKREDGWLQTQAKTLVRNEVKPTYCVGFDADAREPYDLFKLFKDSRIQPEQLIAWTKDIGRFHQIAKEIKAKRYGDFCTVRLMHEEVDPKLEILRNASQRYVWFLEDDEDPYKDLFWWIDRQVNDLEWRYILIQNVWPVTIFNIMQGMSLAQIDNEIKTKEEDFYYEYNFITECAKSDSNWDWEQAKFVPSS